MLSYFASQSVISSPGDQAALYQGLPTSVAALRDVVQGLMVHIFWANQYGLAQLQVSALTAWRFFCWLRDDYQCAQKPLAYCWLLLAPSEAELTYEPKLAEHAWPPLFTNCADAIAHCYNAMQQLPAASAQERSTSSERPRCMNRRST